MQNENKFKLAVTDDFNLFNIDMLVAMLAIKNGRRSYNVRVITMYVRISKIFSGTDDFKYCSRFRSSVISKYNYSF